MKDRKEADTEGREGTGSRGRRTHNQDIVCKNPQFKKWFKWLYSTTPYVVIKTCSIMTGLYILEEPHPLLFLLSTELEFLLLSPSTSRQKTDPLTSSQAETTDLRGEYIQ